MKIVIRFLPLFLFALALLAIYDFHYEVTIRSNSLAELRHYLHQLEKADASQQRFFFAKGFDKAIDRNIVSDNGYANQLNEFKGKSDYPANLVLFLINHLSRKPSRQVAIVEKRGEYLHLILRQYPSKPFELCLKFYQTENGLVLVDIEGLTAYFDYVNCLKQFDS